MARNIFKFFVFALFFTLSASAAKADGAVYAMTNALGSNQILVFHRAANGNLSSTPIQIIATGGGGSGLQLSAVDSLGSAGSLQLDKDHDLLFAVNTETASSNNGAGAYNSDCNQGTITSFRVASDGTLTFADKVSSGGLFPNSIAVGSRDGDDGGDLVYVLNAGGPGTCGTGPNVTGFRVTKKGIFHANGSSQAINPGPTSGTGVNCVGAAGFSVLTGAPAADFECGLNPPSFFRSPAQVRFLPDSEQLVVTVKGTNTIYVFPVKENGKLGNPATTQAPGPALPTYFGFTFDKHENLLVTELFGAATSIPSGGKGAVSSFSVNETGGLSSISSHVGDLGTAAGTIALEPIAGQFAYVSNNLSASISSYSVAVDGSLTLLAGVAAAVSGPNDLATAKEAGASFLYSVEAGSGTVGAFQINLTTGALTPLAGGTGSPGTGAQGLAAY